MLGRLLHCLLFCSVMAGAAAAGPASPRALADDYLRAILDDDWPAARSLWAASDVAASDRLGIRYEGQPFKVDSASLLVLEHARLGTGEITASVGAVETEGDIVRIRFRLRYPDGIAEARSFARDTDEGWCFIAPSTALARGWPRRRTEFLDLRVQPPLRISEEAVRTLDAFVAEVCERLAVPPEGVELLRREKLGYLFCDEATVAGIVGAPTRGAALLQTDAVVTSEPCHLHELAHLIVNFALEELPLFTLPVMQEGAAVALGGRWGRTPEVMSGLGRFVLGEGLLTVDEMLTREDFFRNSADLTYAPAGVFTDFLLERIGGEMYLQLYRSLSGDLATVAGLDGAAVRARICEATGTTWAPLMEELRSRVKDLSCGGFHPGTIAGPEVLAELEGVGLSVTVTGDDRWLHWRIVSKDGPAIGAVLFGGGENGTLPSRLFAEQLPDREFTGETLALVFSPDEVGIYDFRRDLLTTKYVAGFCPEWAAAKADGSVLGFRVDRAAFPDMEWRAGLSIVDR